MVEKLRHKTRAIEEGAATAAITIRKTNDAELQKRRRELTDNLEARMTYRDYRDLARSGLLSPEDMQVYEELQKTGFLLGMQRRG